MKTQISRSSQKTLAVTSQIVAERAINNPRSFISIVNTSLLGEIIYISDGEDAKIGAGVPLSPGGSYQDNIIGTGSDPIYPSQTPIYAIASAATATISIMEKVIVGDD